MRLPIPAPNEWPENGSVFLRIFDAAVKGVFKPTARWDYWSQPKEMRLPSEWLKPLYDGTMPMVC